jgi:hypothetical protein
MINVLSLGAGVQSSTLVYMMKRGDLPKADHAIFADTGWEPKAVYEQLDYLRGLLDEMKITFHQVSIGNIRDDALSGKRFATMPLFTRNAADEVGMVRRQCTNEYKIQPLLNKQRELAGLAPRQRSKEVLVATILGISYDESQRMRDPSRTWLKNEYPLVDRKMTRADCVKYQKTHGFRASPRSACIGCPYKSDLEWRRLKDETPEEFADAVAFDEALRHPLTRLAKLSGDAYLHRSARPLAEADLRTEQERGIMNLFDDECFGMCGT